MDDFRYLFSFTDYERIESVLDIVDSMRGHRYSMNGRLVAHTLVQLFGLLPMWVFDVVNALMFVLQTAIIYKVGRGNGQRNNAVLLAVFCVIWLYSPSFGLVNLWQDGSCNYLWSVVASFLFLTPFVDAFLYDKPIKTVAGKALFLCLSFAAGAYSETVSAAAIFMAMLFVGLQLVYQKKRFHPFWAVSIATAFLGYISIYLAPAQWREKGADMSLGVLLENFLAAAAKYWELFGVLLCAFVILLILNLSQKTQKQTILLALVFFAGSLAANFILTFASYYPSRSAIGAFAFLAVADVILLYPLMQCEKLKILLAGVLAILMLATVPNLVAGVRDVHTTYQNMRDNEAYIYTCKENGIMDVELPMLSHETKYSILSSAKYLDTEDPAIWPNDAMAKYYGVNSIIGVYTE